MKKFFSIFRIFIPFIIAAAMFLLLPHLPYVAEYVFARGIFKAVVVPVGFASSLLPFSLTEILVVAALPGAVALIVLFIKKMKKSEDKKKTAASAARGVGWVLSFASLMYMICHGAGFYRLPTEQLLDLDTSPKTAEHLLAVCKELAVRASEEREHLATDENGVMVFSDSLLAELSRTDNGYDKLIEDYPFMWTSVFRQKPVLLSEPWSYTHITGMWFPFFAECNVNIAQPDFTIPFTAAHESAHSRGIALENDCNFWAFLACINSDYAEFRYSGYAEAYIFCSNALLAYDEEMWYEAEQYCSEGMITDFRAKNDYISAHTGDRDSDSVADQVAAAVNDAAISANDTFITIQGVPEGTLSYGRVTELILAYYEKVWRGDDS